MKRPNFLIIQTDDQGWDDLACHGNPWLETPILDRLYADSFRFSHFYVAPVCAATRASLLTGRHFLRTGVSHVHGGKDFVHPDEVMIGELFQRAGYRTGVWGKWHSGKTNGYFPWERGFHEAWFAGLYQHRDNHGFFNGEKRVHKGEWTVDVITDYALDFMARHRETPFLAYLPYLTVHAPLDGPEELVEKYVAKGLSRGLALIYAMVEQLDGALGRLMMGLADLGLEENTYVLFMSDNGPAVLDDVLSDEDRKLRYVSGYNGHKGNIWENGIKSPLFIRRPGSLSPGETERLADITDIFPTLCDLAGIAIPEDHPRLDGRSLAPYLKGESLPPGELFTYAHRGWQPNGVPYSPLGQFGEYNPVTPEEREGLDPRDQVVAYRTEDYKLLRRAYPYGGCPRGDTVLINMAEDDHERFNLAGSEGERARAMTERLYAWFESVKAGDHPFSTPLFQIKGEDAKDFIPAYAPRRIEGPLVNTAHFLGPWNEKDARSEFGVNIMKPGTYRVRVHYVKEPAGGAWLRASCGDASCSAMTRGEHYQDLGALALVEGETFLSLEAEDVLGMGVGRITMIELSRST